MTSKAPLVICADDYALSQGTSDVILRLLDMRAINATSCLVETAAWPQMSAPLRTLAHASSGLAVGLHLNLTELFPNCAAPDAVGPLPQRLVKSLAPFNTRDFEEVLRSFRHQWALFTQHFDRVPDFIDGHQHIHLFRPARRALQELIAETNFQGWVRQCRTSSARRLAPRLLLDPMSRSFRHTLSGRSRMNPAFGGLRMFTPGENVEALWRVDLAAMPEGGLLMVHPGASDSPSGSEAIDQYRPLEAKLIFDGVLNRILETANLSVSPDARMPGWRQNDPAG